jgi:hypothetical protein
LQCSLCFIVVSSVAFNLTVFFNYVSTVFLMFTDTALAGDDVQLLPLAGGGAVGGGNGGTGAGDGGASFEVDQRFNDSSKFSYINCAL